MRWLALVSIVFALPGFAQDTKKEIQRYQQMIAEGSPVELFELEGEALWKKPQGPKNVSLERCDLGRGPGVLKGAYAGLPRYFKDADGKVIPMHFIQNLTVKVNGKTVVEGETSQAVSRNPVFTFRLKGGAKGDKIEVAWVDNKGESNSTEIAVA